MITSADLLAAATVAAGVLSEHANQDWEAPAGELDWSCRQTADHISDALLFYSVQLASRSPVREPRVREGYPGAGIPGLIGSLSSSAAILARLAEEAGPEARAFHTAGQADTEGFLAMGCDEILVHTADVVAGFGGVFEGDPDLSARLVARLFPWAPSGFAPWETLLWCNGRVALPGHPRLADDWLWQCAPLVEWDGVIVKRARA